jgi:hypothetical protein
MLNDFKVHYMPRYQDIRNKVPVYKVIANSREQGTLGKVGDTVVSTRLDLSAVRVRTFVDGVDRDVDAVTDSEESMTINVQVGAVFPITNLEKLQASDRSPAETIGKNIAIKVSNYLDSVVLKETKNAWAAFDTGNLTTLSSNGTPISLSSTTIPQMVTMAPAKLATNNVMGVNTCWVVDPLTKAAIAQFPIGKELGSADTTFKNGFSGNVYGSELYVSNNLTGEATLVFTGNSVNAEALTIGGVTFTSVTTIGATAGNVLASAGDSTTFITNLAALLNTPGTTTANGVALSAADQITIQDTLGITATATSTTVLTIVCRGSGRLVLTEAQTNATWATNFVHCYSTTHELHLQRCCGCC